MSASEHRKMACLTSVNVSRLWLVPVCVRLAPFDFRLCLQRGINYQVTARWIFNFAVLKSKKKFPPHFARRGKEISTSRDEFFRWWNYFSRSTSEGGRDVKARYARSRGLATAAGLISTTCSFHCSEGASHDAVNDSRRVTLNWLSRWPVLASIRGIVLWEVEIPNHCCSHCYDK